MTAKDKSISDLADLYGVLSDKTRLQIVLLLAKGERNVGSLVEELKQLQPLVSHHLGLLRMNGVIVAKRNGKQVMYALAGNAKATNGKLKISLPPYSVTVEGA